MGHVTVSTFCGNVKVIQYCLKLYIIQPKLYLTFQTDGWTSWAQILTVISVSKLEFEWLHDTVFDILDIYFHNLKFAKFIPDSKKYICKQHNDPLCVLLRYNGNHSYSGIKSITSDSSCGNNNNLNSYIQVLLCRDKAHCMNFNKLCNNHINRWCNDV